MTDIVIRVNRTGWTLAPVTIRFVDECDTAEYFFSFSTRTSAADAPYDKPLYGFMAPTVSFWSPNPYQPQKSVFIQDLGRSDITPSRPIPVSLEFSPDLVTAHCFDLDEFGVGPDESAALDDLRASIASLYRSLKEEKDNLGPLPRKHWDYLSRMIAER